MALVVMVVASLLVGIDGPAPAAARGEQEPGAEEQRAEVRERQGELDLEIDIIEAHAADVADALALLEENVATREAELAGADEAATQAEADLAAATDAVTVAQVRVLQLRAAADDLAVESYMTPPEWTMLDAFQSGSFSDAVIVEALLEIQSESEAAVIDDLEQAEAALAAERDAKAVASDEAEEKRQVAEDRVAEVTAARDQQARFVTAAQEALDQRLLEAANLEAVDAELSRQIAAEQAALAQQLRTLAAQLPPPSAPPTTGEVATATVSCPSGEQITVAQSIAGAVQQLLNAAAADGVILCGWGYRSTDAQIQLRREHCGTSDYAIWDMPSSQCNPPTARPGTSEHEAGLAIDFTCDGTSISSQSSSCFQWLAANAATYGLYNYPVEPWHWSTTGN